MLLKKTAFYGTLIFLITYALMPSTGAPPGAAPAPSPAALNAIKTLEQQFTKELWGVLQDSDCILCHAKPKRTPLDLSKDPRATFRLLLEGGYFESEAHHSLLARLTDANDEKRMPPKPRDRWTKAQINQLKAFSQRVTKTLREHQVQLDEMFPLSLEMPYGVKTAVQPSQNFLTYWQLRQKVKTIFGDDWTRDERNRFDENVTMFGGADFRRSFSESNRPTAQYLSGLDHLARDVASRAYLQRSGPFQNFPDDLPDPLKMKSPDAAYTRAIQRVYNRLLFRDANPQEMQKSFQLIQSLYKAKNQLTPDEYDLQFELIARDSQGRTTLQSIAIPVARSAYSLQQEWADQTKSDPDSELGTHTFSQPVTLKAKDNGQRLRLTNTSTYGVVSIVAVELKGPLPKEEIIRFKATDKEVQVEGAWKRDKQVYHDNGENKGDSHITMPLKVEQDGKYELKLVYRVYKDRYMSAATPIEVFSHDTHRIALPPAPPMPPKGEAHFWIDQTVDTRPYWDSKTQFQFENDSQGVELSNSGTRRTVTADAMKFVPTQGETVMIRAREAEGNEPWTEFKQGEFEAYNTVGPKLLSDENKNKGKLKLIYKPAKAKQWQSNQFYRLHMHYPSREYVETRTPLIVRASASTPIIRVQSPVRSHSGATITIDASATYNTQQTPIQFTWRQIGGPRVQLKGQGAKISFVTPLFSPHQAGWEGLCQALMKHPDFLFSAPPSLTRTQDAKQKKRLQLVKIAQGLIGRPPTLAEVAQVDKGASLEALVDSYLKGSEFQDYYFRRIRLLLESRGTPEEDEPARLWSYVAFNNRPFSEIMTADYSVDPAMRKQARPAQHGKTGLLTMKGFIKGKPGLPHFNYAAVVAEKFLGYVFEVPPEIVEARRTATAASTTQPGSACYSCHKVLTPLAYQRLRWNDQGDYMEKDDKGNPIDDSDQNAVGSYPFKGQGMEAFAAQVVRKERFTRAMINTHFQLLFGRDMRYQLEERTLYKRLWENSRTSKQSIKSLLKGLVLSKEFLG